VLLLLLLAVEVEWTWQLRMPVSGLSWRVCWHSKQQRNWGRTWLLLLLLVPLLLVHLSCWGLVSQQQQVQRQAQWLWQHPLQQQQQRVSSSSSGRMVMVGLLSCRQV
jgi:hypothetical protein